MGTSNSKHDAQAVEYPALPAVYGGGNEAQQPSLFSFKQAPVSSVVPCGSSFTGDPSTFPTELPERPARHSRFSLRKSSKALPPTSPASVSAISIPSPPPSSTSSTTFEPGEPSRITPPSSPPSRFRKPFRFDAVPVNIKKSLSTSDLSTPVNYSRPSRKSRAASSHLSPLALQLPSETTQRQDTELSPFGSDGLVRGLSRLHVSRPNPFTPTESSGRAQSSSSTSSPFAPTEGNIGLHPIEENATVGSLSIPRRPLPRERSEPYLDPERRNDRRQSHRSQSQQILNPFARNNRARQGSLPTYNDFFPDESPATNSSRDGMLEPAPTSTPSTSGGSQARAQEEADRALAEQLQREEDGEYDFYHGLEDGIHRPPSTLSPSTFVRSRGLSFQTPDTGEPSATSGSRDNPIDLDSDDDAWYDLPDDALMEGPGLPPEYDRVQQEDTDAQIAQQLHEEEEERIRRERSPSTRDCVVCGDSTPIPEFPALVECNHQPEICGDCFKGWIASELESKSWDSIKCPGSKCKVIMQHHHVQQYADPEIYAKFDGLSARSAFNDDPNFRWCRGPNCQSGQIHISGEEGNIFRCVACGFRVCVIHEDTWHESETCEEYDYRRSGKKERDQKLQEEASVKAIGELTKRCPGKRCNWPIEKNEGCDHMTCSKCRFEFCWICLAPYGPIRNRGNSAHKKSCKYHSSNIA